MKISFIPREEQFFDLIERSAQYLVEGAVLLLDFAKDYTDLDKKIDRINGVEHACDQVTHTTLERLETTFITPIDREDIHELVLRLDDVIDMTTAAASRMQIFRITAPRPPVIEFAEIILQQTKLLQSAVGRLRNPKHFAMVSNDCIEIHRLENLADDLSKNLIGSLFEKETNPIELLRWKELYQVLETVTDCCEDAANVVQGIVVKNA